MSAEAPGRPLTHWTAETGVKRESPRSDVTPALLAALAPDVERIGPDTVHTVFAVPGTEGWLWHARGCRWRASCNVWEGLSWPEVVPTMAGQRLCYPDNALVFGVAAPPRGNWAIRWLWNRRAAKCWDEVCGLAALGSGIDPAQPPQPPWLLSALGSDAARHPGRHVVASGLLPLRGVGVDRADGPSERQVEGRRDPHADVAEAQDADRRLSPVRSLPGGSKGGRRPPLASPFVPTKG